MKPTDLLKEEHHGVKLALRVLRKIAADIGEKPEPKNTAYVDDLYRMIDFLRVFVDKCHHGKEEDVLFPALLEVGLPKAGGPVQVMLTEHDAGRKLVAAMAGALDRYQSGNLAAAAKLREAVEGYAELLTDHIYKEDNVLYPMADERLLPAVQAGMAGAFDKIEEERIGRGTHERYHEMLKEFKAKYLG